MSLRRCLYVLLLSVCAGAHAGADPMYAINFLPAGFAPAQINDAGQIVGTYDGAAAILAGASITSFGSVLPGSYGLAINDRGAIAGAYGSPYYGYAFAYAGSGGSVTSIQASLPADYTNSIATGINDAGVVVGNALPFIGEAQRGYVYDDGSVRLIGTFGGDWSTATAVNAAGVVTGTGTLPTGTGPYNPDRHAYIDRGGAVQDLGTLGGRVSEGLDINAAGEVAGWSEIDVNPDGQAVSHPFLYRDGALVDLGSLGGYYGYGRALNDAGVVVGLADIVTDVGWGEHAFIYLDGRMVDLNALLTNADGWELVDATDINDAGQILGRACRLGTCTDVRLDLVSDVPEPGAWLLLTAGLALLAWRLRRRGGRCDGGHGAWLASVLALAASGPALAQSSYDVTLLPQGFGAVGIDNAGRIAGSGANADGFQRAAVLDGGTITYLPTLGGNYAGAAAIANGTVIGASASGDFTRGFVYANGTLQNVGVLDGGNSFAYGVNAAGQVVGESDNADGTSHAFLYSGGTLTDLGSLGSGEARAYGINDAGMVVGGSWLGADFPDQGAHAFLYRDGVMTDLGTLGGGFSWAYAINDAGQVAGFSLVGPDAVWHPFLYSDGVMHDLGSFGGDYGQANAINAAGTVVGYSSLPGFQFSHAFVTVNGTMLDLNDLAALPDGFTLTDAVGINDAGQIVGNGCTDFGFCTSVLLTPVPEPSAACLLLAGMPLLLWRRGRHRIDKANPSG